MSDSLDFEKDQLIEVINIGAGHASTALSQMVDKTVNINVPEMFIGPVEKAQTFIGESEKVKTTVLMNIFGATPGMMFVLFSPDTASKLAELVVEKYGNKDDMTPEMEASALKEVGNVILGASLNALSDFLEISIIQSIPEIANDLLGSVVDSVLSEIGKKSDTALVFKVRFKVEGEDITGQFFFLFEPEATSKILELTKKKLDFQKTNE
ncbi:chemotaxis protein CheC [Patescibacteria group bacterium]|nr:chemotaxis protein CheC [Patescibacteria group bacterium]